MLTGIDHAACLSHLQNLIRCNTTNPPGNEITAVTYLKKFLDAAHVPYNIAEPLPGRTSLVARIKGDGSKRPLLLSSHLDVVPAQSEFWSVDPFSGTVQEDCVWGRGAVDMKNMTAMALTVLLKLKAENIPLKRDLVFAAVADEEAGCTYGSQYLADTHPDWLDAEFALNEVGGFSLPIGNTLFYPIGVAEKGFCWFEITAQGEPGHGSLPKPNSALEKIGHALTVLTKSKLPFHNTRASNDFVSGLAEAEVFPKNLAIKGLKTKFWHALCSRLNPDSDSARKITAMFHNTIAPTWIRGGEKINVVPGSATLGVDGRIVPGSSISEFLSEVKKILGPDFTIQVLKSQEPSETPNYRTDFYQHLTATLQKHDPGCVPVPFLVPGFSDSYHYRRLGISCYGFAPAKLPKTMNLADLYHAHDERLPLSALQFGVSVLWDVVHTWCCR